jgi:transposase
MDRQTLRDWVIRYNEQGPDGLINIPSPGAPPKLDDTQKAFLRRIVEESPIPAIQFEPSDISPLGFVRSGVF